MENKWILKYTDEAVSINHYYWTCSACEKGMLVGKTIPSYYKYCPDCGAKLDLGIDMLHHELIQDFMQRVKENIELYKAGTDKGYDVSVYKAKAFLYIEQIKALYKEAYEDMLSHEGE